MIASAWASTLVLCAAAAVAASCSGSGGRATNNKTGDAGREAASSTGGASVDSGSAGADSGGGGSAGVDSGAGGVSGSGNASDSGTGDGSAPPGDISGWQRVFVDEFNGSSPGKAWSLYNGKYGGGVAHYASKTHVYESNGVLHLLGKLDSSGAYGKQWYTGGACLCGDSSAAWQQVVDVRTVFRWRVVNTGLVTSYMPKYAFLRWPKSGIWPQDGEEDFLEGNLDVNAGTTFTLHAANSSGKNVNAYQKSFAYDPTTWHIVSYERHGYHAVVTVDGATQIDYTGSEASMPSTLKHIVFQQECNYSGCPTGGTSDVQIDWVVVYIPV